MISQKITKEIEGILRALKAKFENNFLALILYGSWAKVARGMMKTKEESNNESRGSIDALWQKIVIFPLLFIK